jgi:hypothetical protein
MAPHPVELDPSYPRGRFCGSVHCASTGTPLPSAKIKLQGFEPRTDNFFGIRQHGETDQNGRFDIPAIPAGTYHAFATLPGYVSSASLLPMKSLFGVRTHFEVPDAVLDAALPESLSMLTHRQLLIFSLRWVDQSAGPFCGRMALLLEIPGQS